MVIVYFNARVCLSYRVSSTFFIITLEYESQTNKVILVLCTHRLPTKAAWNKAILAYYGKIMLENKNISAAFHLII